MRCLSIRQPWAWQVCANLKQVENRTWSTDHRGTIAIHAGSSKQELNAWLRKLNDVAVKLAMFPTGAIIGVADIVNVVDLNPELESVPSASGPACWKFANGRLLPKPIAQKGKLNLFFLPDELTAEIHAQLAGVKPADLPTIPKALTAEQSDAERWQRQIWRAESYAQLNRTSDAIRCLTVAIELDPQAGSGYRMRGSLYSSIGEMVKARVDLDRAIALHAEDAVAHWVRSEVNRALGNDAQASSDDRRALELDPTLADAEPPASEK